MGSIGGDVVGVILKGVDGSLYCINIFIIIQVKNNLMTLGLKMLNPGLKVQDELPIGFGDEAFCRSM
jgi:hypothetical protein